MSLPLGLAKKVFDGAGVAAMGGCEIRVVVIGSCRMTEQDRSAGERSGEDGSARGNDGAEREDDGEGEFSHWLHPSP